MTFLVNAEFGKGCLAVRLKNTKLRILSAEVHYKYLLNR